MRLKKPAIAVTFSAVMLTLTLSSAQGYYNAPAYALPSAAALGPWPWNADIGGGPAPVLGSSRNQLTSGSVFTIGAGYNATPRAGFVVEFMDAGLGVTDSVIQQNQAIDGTAWVRSVTFNPIWRYRIGGPVGGYIIGGGGWYEKEIELDEPVLVALPPFVGGGFATGIATSRQYDDTGGLNIGTGITWNIGWGTKFFMEVRYHYIFTSGTATQLIPITFGFRW